MSTNVRFVNAMIFRDAYLILKDNQEEGTAKKDQRKMVLTVPVAVNGAFACEMFLKAMLPSTVRGHRLDELFEKLQPSTKSIIISSVITEVKYTEKLFMEHLKENGDVFVDWRYFHEKSVHYNATFMDAFQNALAKFCIDNNVGRIEEPSF